jgi:hypothetical protein
MLHPGVLSPQLRHLTRIDFEEILDLLRVTTASASVAGGTDDVRPIGSFLAVRRF